MTAIVSGIFKIKKPDIWHTGGLWDRYSKSLKKDTVKFCQNVWLQKYKKNFPQNSIADWKSIKSSILMKYDMNIMKIHKQFISIFNISNPYYDLFAPTI